jgi:hypothetical protein
LLHGVRYAVCVAQSSHGMRRGRRHRAECDVCVEPRPLVLARRVRLRQLLRPRCDTRRQRMLGRRVDTGTDARPHARARTHAHGHMHARMHARTLTHVTCTHARTRAHAPHTHARTHSRTHSRTHMHARTRTSRHVTSPHVTTLAISAGAVLPVSIPMGSRSTCDGATLATPIGVPDGLADADRLLGRSVRVAFGRQRDGLGAQG